MSAEAVAARLDDLASLHELGQSLVKARVLGSVVEHEARAELRRRTWSGGVAHGFEEAERMDLEFWMAATPGERIRGVTQLIDDVRWMQNDAGPTPRLQRAVGGVRPRKG